MADAVAADTGSDISEMEDWSSAVWAESFFQWLPSYSVVYFMMCGFIV